MTETRDLTITLDGKSDFDTLWGSRSWDEVQDADSGTSGFMQYQSFYLDNESETLETTALLSGTDWFIVNLRFGGAYNNIATVRDLDDSAGRSITTLSLGYNSDVDLISTQVKFIVGWDGDLHDVTLGSGYTAAVELAATTNIVATGSGFVASITTENNSNITIGSGGAGSLLLGTGTNTVVTGSGWVGQINASGESTITIGSGGADYVGIWGDGSSNVQLLEGGYITTLALGRGENTVAIDSGSVESIVANGSGLNNITVGSGSVEFIRLSKGVNTLDVGDGGVTSVVAYSGATTIITVGSGYIDQIRLSSGTHTITASEGENDEESYIGTVTVYGDSQTNLTLGSGGAQSVTLSYGADSVVTGSGYVGQLNAGGGDDEITLNGNFGTVMAGEGDDIVYIGEGAFGHMVAGGNGADYFSMGPLTDPYEGCVIEGGYDDSIDMLDLSGFGTNLTVTLNRDLQWQDLGAGWVALLGIEGITGGSGDDVLTGSSFGPNNRNNVLDGGDGSDLLFGGAGDDRLLGGDGDDVIDDGTGTDFVDGGNGIDTFQRDLSLDYDDFAFDAVVDLNAGRFYSAGNENDFDTLVNIENVNLTGNFHDSIIGNGGNNSLNGGAGNDSLNGGTGTDTLIGGTGDDTYVTDGSDTITEAANAGTDTVQSSATITLAVNLENLTLTGSGAINGTGNTLSNVLTGNSAANSISGGGGNDTIIGGGGNDTLEGAAGNDSLTGGDGVDTASYNGSAAAVTVNLSLTSAQNTVGAGTDTLITIENLIGSAYNDTLTGNANANVLNGGAGNDRLTGGAGNDAFIFNNVQESGTTAAASEVITDFVRGQDKIDLSAIDAFASTSANDTFIWRGTANFSSNTQGEVRFQRFDLAGTANDHTMIWIDNDADTGVEMAIRLTGLYNLTASDFVL